MGAGNSTTNSANYTIEIADSDTVGEDRATVEPEPSEATTPLEAPEPEPSEATTRSPRDLLWFASNTDSRSK